MPRSPQRLILPESNLALIVGGLTPLTTTDYPGCLSAVIFCQGCPWRCGYCQNPHLLPPRAENPIAWRDIVAFLLRRRGLLDAVVFSGGDATLQNALAEAIDEVRSLGFKVGLHTASPYPERLLALLPGLDWVGLDIKAPFNEYDAVTGIPGSGEKARAGLAALLKSGVAYEVRTTLHSRLHTPESLLRLACELKSMGVQNYVLQEFRPQGCADADLCAMSRPLLNADLVGRIASLFPGFTLRQA